jgi:hypothetical protein
MQKTNFYCHRFNWFTSQLTMQLHVANDFYWGDLQLCAVANCLLTVSAACWSFVDAAVQECDTLHNTAAPRKQ